MNEVRPYILVGVGEEDVTAAVRWAVERAAASGCDVRLVHAAHSPYGLAGPETILLSFEAAEQAGRQLVRGAEERALDAADDRVGVAADVVVGAPVPVLTDLARHSTAVVLQHKRRSRLAQIVAGSVAAGIAARADVPVVSVPDDWSPRSAERRARITVGVSDLKGADDLIARALEEAAIAQADITLVHAWDLPTAYEVSLLSVEQLTSWGRQVAQDLQALVDAWKDKAPEVTIETRAERGRPAGVLVKASHDSDLLLVARARTWVPGHHLGSVARAVLRESACPVEVVPQTRS
jgi:nucleotide-binding universal stress UspA family protein